MKTSYAINMLVNKQDFVKDRDAKFVSNVAVLLFLEGPNLECAFITVILEIFTKTKYTEFTLKISVTNIIEISM